MPTAYLYYFPLLPKTAFWIEYKSLDTGMAVENEHTIRVARFKASSYNSREMWRNSPFNPNPRSVAICANRGTRYAFPDFDEALAWCRSMRYGVKVEREFVPIQRWCLPLVNQWNETHELHVRLVFKNLVHATYFKLRWWPSV